MRPTMLPSLTEAEARLLLPFTLAIYESIRRLGASSSGKPSDRIRRTDLPPLLEIPLAIGTWPDDQLRLCTCHAAKLANYNGVVELVDCCSDQRTTVSFVDGVAQQPPNLSPKEAWGRYRPLDVIKLDDALLNETSRQLYNGDVESIHHGIDGTVKLIRRNGTIIRARTLSGQVLVDYVQVAKRLTVYNRVTGVRIVLTPDAKLPFHIVADGWDMVFRREWRSLRYLDGSIFHNVGKEPPAC